MLKKTKTIASLNLRVSKLLPSIEKMSSKIILSCGFSPIHCNFLRKSALKKGGRLIQHVFDVVETRDKEKNTINISGKCVRQASINKAPYKIELELNNQRTVISALCQCIAGVQGNCKHSGALIAFVNQERTESKTDLQCQWQAPTLKGKSLYPKGQTLDSIIKNPKPTAPLSFKGPTENQIQDQIALMVKNGMTNSMMYKMLTAKPITPAGTNSKINLPEWVSEIFEPKGTNSMVIF